MKQGPYDREGVRRVWISADTGGLEEGNTLLDNTQVEVQDHMRNGCWDQGILPAGLDR